MTLPSQKNPLSVQAKLKRGEEFLIVGAPISLIEKTKPLSVNYLKGPRYPENDTPLGKQKGCHQNPDYDLHLQSTR